MSQNESLPPKTFALIVGAGPSGLALSGTLLNNGVPSTDVHDPARCLVTKVARRACMLLLDSCAFSQTYTLREKGRAGPLLSASFKELDSPYQTMAMIPQSITEEILDRRVQTLGGCVRRNWKLESYEIVPDPDGTSDNDEYPVLAQLTHENGDKASVRAKVIIGADGGHSIVRRTAGLTFEGGTYPNSFMLADIKVRDRSWPWNRTDLGFDGIETAEYLGPWGFMLLAPLPGGRIRLVGNVSHSISSDHLSEADHGGHATDKVLPTLEEVQALLDERGPEVGEAKAMVGSGGKRPNEVEEIVWASRYHVHHRVTSSFRAERVCLVGDAAHVHSPAGGQGMNIGIQDGVTLALAISSLLNRQRQHAGSTSTSTHPSPLEIESTLEEWATKRLAVAHTVVSQTDAMTKAGMVEGEWMAWARNRVVQVVGVLPKVSAVMARNTAGLQYR